MKQTTTQLIRSLREFGEMGPEGGDIDPLIDVFAGLAREAADALEHIGPRIEFHQADWIPGFAAFVDDGKKFTRDPDSKAFCVLNLGSFLAAIQTGDLSREDLAREVADCMCHEVLHVIEKWCGIEFSEDRVNGLLDKYRDAALAEGERD